MLLAGWLRSSLWQADDWRAALALLADGLDGTADPARAVELGRALEHVDPDRRRALAAYRAAWQAGGAEALAPARRIAREIRDHAAVATLAAEAHERPGGAPGLLLEAAAAWIDAGQPTRALRPLAAAARALPGDERVASLRAALDGAGDARAEVARWFERAVTTGQPEAACHAIRLARLGRSSEDQLGRLLRSALDRWPGDDDVAALVEEHLLRRGDADELLIFYKLRLGTKPGAAAWADEVRAIASRLCVRGVSPGLGLRLIRKGLEHAYRAGLVELPGHLASWALLADHARAVRATRELVPLVVTALGLPLGDADRLWLGRFGLEAVWRDAGDAEAAAAYAAVVIELAPDHPDVREFVREQDFDIDVDDGEVAGEGAIDLDDDPSIAELARSLVYLDEHGDRAYEPPPPARPPVAPPPTPTEVAAIGAQAIAATSQAVAVIPAAAMAALRRISTRVRTPTAPPLRDGARDRAVRVVVPVDVTIELDDGRRVEAVVRDVSTTGLYVVLAEPLDIGAELSCELGLPSPDDPLATTRHRAWARVVRKGDGGYGLELLDPEPALVEAIAALTPGRPG